MSLEKSETFHLVFTKPIASKRGRVVTKGDRFSYIKSYDSLVTYHVSSYEYLLYHKTYGRQSFKDRDLG